MMQEGVVLLHGIFRTKWSMWGLERFLRKHGYRVLNVNYKSTKYGLEDLVEQIHPQIAEFNKSLSGNLHFVGYSMGGLIIRGYLHKYRPANLGRVVMLGTPNKGSEVADFVKDWRLYRAYGPAGQQLVTDQTGFAHLWGFVDYQLGVLAGNAPLDFISSQIIGKENDGKVSVDSTMLDGMADHRIIRIDHTFFPHSRVAWEHTLSFLQNGFFT